MQKKFFLSSFHENQIYRLFYDRDPTNSITVNAAVIPGWLLFLEIRWEIPSYRITPNRFSGTWTPDAFFSLEYARYLDALLDLFYL